MSEVYHLELRQFPHVTRVFNLGRTELETRFVQPWVKGEMIDQDERRWAPERTRLKVLIGPALRPDALGLGRGWGSVTKDSQDVTEAVIAEAQRGAHSRPEVEALKQQIVRRISEPFALSAVMALADVAHPGWRASEKLAVAEQAVWELLHQERVTMRSGDAEIPREHWEATVLRFSTWAPGAEITLRQTTDGGNGRG
jgi:hypothetical protein